jgi:hypothetical protein
MGCLQQGRKAAFDRRHLGIAAAVLRRAPMFLRQHFRAGRSAGCGLAAALLGKRGAPP